MSGGSGGKPRETIVIVHGTFTGHDEKQPKWWHPKSEDCFIARLHAGLQERGVALRCWAHEEDSIQVFHWSGRNHWVDRAESAARLAAYVKELSTAGWACHLVGHSHGGNVIVDALRLLKGRPEEGSVRSVATLGTPFLDLSAVVAGQQRQTQFDLWVVIYLSLAFILAFPFVRFWQQGALTAENAVMATLSGVGWLVIFGLFLGIKAVFDRWLSKARSAVAAERSIPALAVNSPYDEAWQLLHHVREAASPVAVKEGILRYLYGRAKSYVDQRSEVARIFGAVRFGDLNRWQKLVCGALFAVVLLMPVADLIWFAGGEFSWQRVVGLLLVMYPTFLVFVAILSLGAKWLMSAYVWPSHYVAFILQSAFILPNEVGVYIVRRQMWPFLQRFALGLDGYGFDLPKVQTLPDKAGSASFSQAWMPADAQARALEVRSHGIARHVGSAATVLTRIALSAEEISDLLGEIEADQTLVHAAYYQDERCLQQLADWLASQVTSGPVVSCNTA